MSPDYFPKRPVPSITLDDVVAYLTGLQAEGEEIYQEGGAFVVALTATDQMYLTPLTQGICQVSHKSAKGPSASSVTVENMGQLDEYVRRAIRNMKSPAPTTSARTKRGSPRRTTRASQG